MEARDRQRIAGLGTLVLAIGVLGVIGWVIQDFNGVSFAEVGALIWGGGVLITFILGTAYLSRRLLPLQGNQGWSDGFRLLGRNYLMGAANFLYGRPRISATEVLATAAAASKKKGASEMELPPSFKLIGAGFLFSHQAAAITYGNSYVRPAGPGLVILRSGEKIAQVFDLRPQSRKMNVSAITRDGIPVETNVSVTFQVRRPASDQRRARSIERDAIPYPYDRDALFDLTYTASVGDDAKLEWTEQVCPQAATLLVTEIGKYTLDELLLSAGAEPMGEIRDRIKSGLKEQQEDDHLQTLSRGIDIMNVSVGPLELPKDVTAKRLATWQASWQNRVAMEDVGNDLETQRLYTQALTRAQAENIEKLLVSIENMRQQTDVELHQVVMLRVVELLEAIAASRVLIPPSARALLADLAGEATSEIRQALESQSGAEGRS